MRLFFAVILSDAIRQAIDGWMADFRRTGADVRWVPAENLHVTLKFLGEIPEAELPSITAAAAAVLQEIPSFSLSVAEAGAFPSRGTPRVLWVGIQDGATVLEHTAQRLNEALETLGIARETKPFREHLTVGRVKSPKGVPKVLRMMEQAPAEFGAMMVSSVKLMQSVLRPAGAEYTAVQSFELITSK